MSQRLLVSLSLLALGACGGGESIEVARQGIVNGRPHAGHPSVGLVRDESGGFCTGTLVGSRTVLSAAHCIFPSTAYSFELEGQSYPVIRARAPRLQRAPRGRRERHRRLQARRDSAGRALGGGRRASQHRAGGAGE